jgi:hypothetical protein
LYNQRETRKALMNLETRVETLEHELKILKNEIEETLLEIQNQILIHYYPALRAEDSTPPQDLPPILPTRAKPQLEEAPPATAPFPTIAPSPGSQMKEVSLSDLLKAKSTSAAGAPAPPVKPAGGAPGDAAVATLPPAALAHLAKWVTQAVERLGKAQAILMVESCADAEACTPAVLAALLQLLALAEEEAPPPTVETAAVMDTLLRLNRVVDQVADYTAESTSLLPGR